MGQEQERRAALRELAEIGWGPPDDPPKQNKKGYIKVLCGCGAHKFWLHKTPSNPNFFREKVAYARRICGPATGDAP